MLRVKSSLVRCFVCAFMLLFVVSAPAAPADRDRSYVAANVFLSIGGAPCGFIKSVDGGGISAEVIQEPSGPAYFVKKHVGQPRYEDLTLQIGFSMSSAVYAWVANSWAMNNEPKTCSVTACDHSMDAKDTTEYTNCLITETVFPACDGSSKEPSYLTIKVAPEFSRAVAPVQPPAGSLAKQQNKVWLPSNFELKIDGLDCTKVNKIESFTIKQAAVTNNIGDARDMAKEPGKLEFPNLRITFSEVNLPAWKAWFDSFVIQGNNDDLQERSGTLTLLTPNRQEALLAVRLHNLGICKLEREKAEAAADQITRWTAELYCERMELVMPEGGAAGSTTSTSTTPAAPTTVPGADSSPTGARKFGNPPFDFAIKGLEYTVTRQYVGTAAQEPDAGSKLMLIRYTIHNPSERAMNLSMGMLKFQITDSAGANHEIQDIGVGANNQRIGGSLNPGQTVDCCAIARLPGNVDAEGLAVACSTDIERYKVAGQARIREEFARDASAGAAAVYTALPEVSIGAGTFYPMMSLDYRLDEIGFAERPKVESRARENTRCLVATFTLRNPSQREISCGTGGFSAALRMSDGSSLTWVGYPLSSQEDRPVPIELTPGQELKMRVFFDVPISETVTPASFRFSQGRGRVYFAELQQVRQPARKGA